jgi:hypothetical protein
MQESSCLSFVYFFQRSHCLSACIHDWTWGAKEYLDLCHVCCMVYGYLHRAEAILKFWLVWNLRVHNCVHKSLPLEPLLSQVNSVHDLAFCFLTFIWILSSHLPLGLRSGLFPCCLPSKMFAGFISFVHATCSVHFICFEDDPDNVWWGVQILKLCSILMKLANFEKITNITILYFCQLIYT